MSLSQHDSCRIYPESWLREKKLKKKQLSNCNDRKSRNKPMNNITHNWRKYQQFIMNKSITNNQSYKIEFKMNIQYLGQWTKLQTVNQFDIILMKKDYQYNNKITNIIEIVKIKQRINKNYWWIEQKKPINCKRKL